MRAFSTLALAGCMWLALGSTAFADVRISIRDGRVTLAAKDATVRQILTEWARVGRTQIVNVERISGGPVTATAFPGTVNTGASPLPQVIVKDSANNVVAKSMGIKMIRTTALTRMRISTLVNGFV